MMMSDTEICASYRDAKNKNSQIEVLAELNATTTENIKEILKKRGALFGKRGPKPKLKELAETAGIKPENMDEPITAENLAKAAGITLDKTISEKLEAQKEAEEKPEEAAVVPHIRVPIPPIVIEAVEEKLSDLETKIKYHEEQLTLLNRQYKEIVDYLQAEGKL